jgi:hypothetical protein
MYVCVPRSRELGTMSDSDKDETPRVLRDYRKIPSHEYARAAQVESSPRRLLA